MLLIVTRKLCKPTRSSIYCRHFASLSSNNVDCHGKSIQYNDFIFSLCGATSCRQDSIDAARQQVEAAVGSNGLQLLVNNAGVGLVAPVEHFPLDDFR